MAKPGTRRGEDAGIALARYAATVQFGDLPPQVVTKVKDLILDSFGIALAGSTAPGIDAAVAAIKGWGGVPESTLYAYGLRLPAPWVAMVNGAMSTARDFDDTLDDAMLHTQPSVLPAVLTIAEAEGDRSGRDLITAVSAGAELLCRMGHARRRGQEFLPTGTCAGMEAAGAAARLIGLPFEGVLNACGIAYSQCAANIQPLLDGATVKRFHAGLAARNGVVSATLARHGLTGAHNWLEGEFGYFNLYERGDYEPADLTTELGERFDLLDLSLKPWPQCPRHARRRRSSARAGGRARPRRRPNHRHRRLSPAERLRLVGKTVGGGRRTPGGRSDRQRGLLRRRCAHPARPPPRRRGGAEVPSMLRLRGPPRERRTSGGDRSRGRESRRAPRRARTRPPACPLSRPDARVGGPKVCGNIGLQCERPMAGRAVRSAIGRPVGNGSGSVHRRANRLRPATGA